MAEFGAVAGSHGKTTTTSMVAAILNHAGLDPTVVVGGSAAMGGSERAPGRGDFLVVESDESDGSFLKLAPIIAVVTNIDREHAGPLHRPRGHLRAFVEFVERGSVLRRRMSAWTTQTCRAFCPPIKRRTVTYGTTAQAHLRAVPIWRAVRSPHSVHRGHTISGMFHLALPALHSVSTPPPPSPWPSSSK